MPVDRASYMVGRTDKRYYEIIAKQGTIVLLYYEL
jgi:hypothetical protein